MDLKPAGAAPSLDSILKAIESSRFILDLKDDRDEEGAVGYSAEPWERATEFLRQLAISAFQSLAVTIHAPRILPGPDGSIDIHWKTDDYELLLNFPSDPDEPGSYYGDNKQGNMPIKNSFDQSKPDRKLIAWLCLFD